MFKYTYEKLMGISGLVLAAAVAGIWADVPEAVLGVLLGIAIGFKGASLFCFFKEECK